MDKGTHYNKEFDRRYAYEGCDLGCTCTPDRAVFKLWSPEAARVELFLYRDGDAPAYASRVLEQEEQGIWALTLEGDCHGVYYDYEVTVAGNTARTADPYASACGCNGARSMAVDLSRTDPEGFEEDAAPPLPPENIIYELHVKDFSHHPDSGVPEELRGRFKAFAWRDQAAARPCAWST